MQDEDKTKGQLMNELGDLRQRVAELEALETEHKRAAEELRERNRDLALLNHASQVFNSTLDLDQVLATVLGAVSHLLGVFGASVWLIEPETGELVCRQASGPRGKIMRGWHLPPGEGITGWVAGHGESLIVSDARADERYYKDIDQQAGVELRSILSVPLRVKGYVSGVLEVLDIEADRFDAADLRLVESLAATAAIAIENAQWYERARQDAETKATLLREVNHRVKNNLSAIIGLLYTEQRHARKGGPHDCQTILKNLANRIRGLATVHNMLSDAEWKPLPLSKLVRRIIHSALQTLPHDERLSVNVSPSSVQVTPKQANSLALVINELVTNAAKHALPERHTTYISVRIVPEGDTVLFEFRDDGPGYPEEVLQLETRNVGLYLMQTLVHHDLDGELALHNDHGAVTTIRFKNQMLDATNDAE